MIKSAYKPLFLQPLLKLLSLLGNLSNSIVKVIKLLYNVLKAKPSYFTIYYLYYKIKLIGNQTRTFVYAINYLYFLCYLSNLSAAFFLAHNSGVCIVEIGLITKKRKLLIIPYILFLTFSNLYFSGFLAQLSLNTPGNVQIRDDFQIAT